MSAIRMYELLAQAALEQEIAIRQLPGGMDSPGMQLGGNPAKVILKGRIFPGADLALATLSSFRHAANGMMKESGILVPQSMSLQVWPTEDALISPDAEKSVAELLAEGGRWVLKPALRKSGLPLNLNVTEPADLTGHLEDHADEPSEWVLEAFLDGTGLAVLAVDGEVVAARQQAAFSLTGDGMQTLEELIDAYNAQAGEGAQFMMNAEARQLLRDQDAFLGEVVPAGKSIRLSNKPLDLRQTATVSPESMSAIQELVGQLKNVFPGPVMGLDLIMDSKGIHVIGVDMAPQWIDFVDAHEAAQVASKLLRAALK